MQRVNDRASTDVVVRILLGQPRSDRVHFGPRLLQRDIRLQSRDHLEKVFSPVHGFLRRKSDRHPDLVAPLAERREAHAVRQYADDGVAFAVQGDGAADHARIATETPLP